MMPQKISIIGSYTRQSVGDRLILLSLLDVIFRVGSDELRVEAVTFDFDSFEREIAAFEWRDRVDIRAISVTRSPTRTTAASGVLARMKQGAVKRLPPVMVSWIRLLFFVTKMGRQFSEDSRGLLIGGGNLLMDLFPTMPVLLWYAEMCFVRSNRPVVLGGVGAFPIRTWLGASVLGSLVRRAEAIFVRDNETREFIRLTWGRDALLHPDFALSFPQPVHPSARSRQTVIAVNVAPVYGPEWPEADDPRYRDYIASVARSLCQLHAARDCVLVLFDTNYPTDSRASEELIAQLVRCGVPRGSIEYSPRLCTVAEIVGLLGRASLCVATRMHASLLALRVGIPVVAIGYQPKVSNVMRELGLQDSVVQIEKLSKLDERLSAAVSDPSSFALDAARLRKLDEANEDAIAEILAIFHLAVDGGSSRNQRTAHGN